MIWSYENDEREECQVYMSKIKEKKGRGRPKAAACS